MVEQRDEISRALRIELRHFQNIGAADPGALTGARNDDGAQILAAAEFFHRADELAHQRASEDIELALVVDGNEGDFAAVAGFKPHIDTSACLAIHAASRVCHRHAVPSAAGPAPIAIGVPAVSFWPSKRNTESVRSTMFCTMIVSPFLENAIPCDQWPIGASAILRSDLPSTA